MKKFTLKVALLLTATFALSTNAQEKTPVKGRVFGQNLTQEIHKCGTTEYETLLRQKNSKRSTTEEFEQWLAPKVNAIKAQTVAMGNTPFSTNEVVTIPVVVHVIHNGSPVGVAENISDEQVLSQITVLNQDFRKMMDTPGYNENPVGADMEIEFCIAQRDPNGIASSGIIRYNMGDGNGWQMEDIETNVKPQTQWDPTQYLNIWVVDYAYVFGGELAGYAQFPTQSGLDGIDGTGQATAANTDGVVIGHLHMGSREIYPQGTYDDVSGKDEGRTATHEVGHFFGLRHIWGDGDCSADDYCDDTPIAAGANQGCTVGTDSCPQSPGEDMIENYMDYTVDDCQNVFTQDQKARMQAVLLNSPRRASLITSLGCQPGIVPELDGSLNINELNNECSDTFIASMVLRNQGSTTITSAAISYNIDGENETVYNWEGSLETNEETIITLDEITVESGEHSFNGTLTSVNGTTDEISDNDTFTRDFTIVAFYNTTQIIVNVMTDDFGDETIWALLDSNEDPIFSNIDINNPWNSDFYDNNQLYTETIDIDPDQCYYFAILDLEGDGICCEYGNGYFTVTTTDGTVIAEGGSFTDQVIVPFGVTSTAGVNNFATGNTVLYPNPANTSINISIPQGKVLPENYTVYNNLGQVMANGNITTDNTNIDISGLANGIYFVKVNGGSTTETLQFVKK